MKIFVKAKPNTKQEKVEKIDETHFIVSVREPPRQGRANEAIIKVLAEYFNVSCSQIRLVRGFTSKEKVFEILRKWGQL